MNIKFSTSKCVYLFIGLIFFNMLSLERAFANTPVPVEVRRTAGKWQLFRGGKPYQVRGVGGYQYLELLVASGGNSFRTWGIDERTGELLDRAEELGLTVSLGLWLGHERHGFDYGDAKQVAKQKEDVRQAVLKYRHHPALLLWGLGNEMEGFESGDNPKIWKAVNDIAEMIQSLDTNHPVMTTTADIGGGRVPSVEKCPAIDIHGVNSYGGGPSLPKRYLKAGGTRPLLFTEYGPRGTWEIPFNDFDVPPEKTSTAKAEVYRQMWTDTIANNPQVLGGYAFLWGWKTEATATWFGLFLPDGTRLGGVDALAEAWEHPPTNRAPFVTPLVSIEGQRLKPGSVIHVSWSVTDPEGNPLNTTWSLHRELENYFTGGDSQAMSPRLIKSIESSGVEKATIRLPKSEGVYRLYATTRDNHGGGANANLPLLVGKPREKGSPLPMPWWVYQDAEVGGPWAPSGWMGNIKAIEIDTKWTNEPASAPSCIQVTLKEGGWAGVAWQYPVNDWGEKKDSVDLSEARFLSFKVRSYFDFGKKIKFGVGLLGKDRDYPDSLKVEKSVKLTQEWSQVRLRLRGDRSKIKTGFWWIADHGPITFYLDDIVFE